jgi:hypothetical protein
MPALPSSPAVPDGNLAPSPPLRAGGDTVAKLLARRGLLSAEQLTYAKRVQAKLVSARPLIEIFKELRLLSNADLSTALKEDLPGIRLGDLLVELGHIRPAELETALIHAAGKRSRLKLGDILVDHGFIDEPQLVEILASQLGLPFVVPQYERINRDLLRQMPPKLFSRNSFLPVENQAGKVVVAFADPLDREVAERCGYRALAEQAHLAGLLHDIVKWLPLTCFAQLADSERGIALADQLIAAVLENLHVEVGLQLIADWHLPDEFARVVGGHH